MSIFNPCCVVSLHICTYVRTYVHIAHMRISTVGMYVRSLWHMGLVFTSLLVKYLLLCYSGTITIYL